MTAKNCITGRTYYWELELSERDFKINVIYKELKGLITSLTGGEVWRKIRQFF